jgi:cation diffusion facilitator family transporter
VAVAGLCVNVVCALLLKDGHHHPHSHGGGTGHEERGHGTHEHDLNLRSAYVHVLADALTSVTAIVALLSGKYFGWYWLDAAMGIAGSLVVGSWAYGLVRDTSGILLDRTPTQSDLPQVIRRTIESDGDAVITDLHVWQVGAGKFAAIVSLVATNPKSPAVYRGVIGDHEELVHVTIEVHSCKEQGITTADVRELSPSQGR